MASNHAPSNAAHIDQRVSLYGVSWDEYEAFLAMRGESSALRVTYWDGELEIMAPSMDHEGLKTRLARLLEAWAEESEIALEGAGSWTVKLKIERVGAEADECYFVGEEMRGDHPDLAIEVVWTSGGLDKLELWSRLGVPEVWIWEAGSLSIFCLEGKSYLRALSSRILPSFEPEPIVTWMNAPCSQTRAVRGLREGLRQRPK